MKQLYILCTLAVLVIVAACGDKRVAEPACSVGHLENIDSFPSKYIDARTIRIWTPSTYNDTTCCDVLYMHDGQMLYDANFAWNHQEWRIDEVVDSLINCGAIRPCIVVGIDNHPKLRFEEYTPDDMVQFLPKGESVYPDKEAMGNDYLHFIVDELKPYVDSTYNVYTTPEHTYIMGSSCGGLISQYALCKYPDVFGGAACLSTNSGFVHSFTMSVREVSVAGYMKYLHAHLPEANSRLLYMDRGDKGIDSRYADSQRAINEVVKSLGWDDQHYMYRYYPGHDHCEDDWASRLEQPLKFLLGK